MTATTGDDSRTSRIIEADAVHDDRMTVDQKRAGLTFVARTGDVTGPRQPVPPRPTPSTWPGTEGPTQAVAGRSERSRLTVCRQPGASRASSGEGYSARRSATWDPAGCDRRQAYAAGADALAGGKLHVTEPCSDDARRRRAARTPRHYRAIVMPGTSDRPATALLRTPSTGGTPRDPERLAITCGRFDRKPGHVRLQGPPGNPLPSATAWTSAIVHDFRVPAVLARTHLLDELPVTLGEELGPRACSGPAACRPAGPCRNRAHDSPASRHPLPESMPPRFW